MSRQLSHTGPRLTPCRVVAVDLVEWFGPGNVLDAGNGDVMGRRRD